MEEATKVLNFDDDKGIMEVLNGLTESQLGMLKQFIYAVEMERDSINPAVAKGYYEEFEDVFLADILSEGDIAINIIEEIDILKKKKDQGSAERLFYLYRWANKRLGLNLRGNPYEY